LSKIEHFRRLLAHFLAESGYKVTARFFTCQTFSSFFSIFDKKKPKKKDEKE